MTTRSVAARSVAARRATALPPWAALGLAALAGVMSATQSAANGELGQRIASPPAAALVNTTIGVAVLLVAVCVMPSVRATVRAWVPRRRAGTTPGVGTSPGMRLPWWTYLGGVGGIFFIIAAVYAVPVIGVAVFTIALVTGNSATGLVVDRVGLSPAGRLRLTRPRMLGAGLGVAAVGVSQLGRPVGDLAVASLLLGVAAGAGLALQSALNGRVAAAGTPAAATLVNYVVAMPLVVLFSTSAGVFTGGWPDAWPAQWYLYAGGVLGVVIVAVLVVTVRVIGVLRSGLLMVAGQLVGAFALDALIPGGAHPSPALAAGAMLTLVAAWVAGWSRPGRQGRSGSPREYAGQMEVLRFRPRRIRLICVAAAGAVLVVFTTVGLALRGPTGEGSAVFRPGDRAAMIGLGVLGAAAILAFMRPRVDADGWGIRIRNLIGGHDLPWEVVRAVRFDRGSPWASLELHDDDVVQVMAVQVIDKGYALDAVRALRRLHAAASAATSAGVDHEVDGDKKDISRC